MAGSLHLAHGVSVAQEVPRRLGLEGATFHGDHRGTSLRQAEGRVPERKGYLMHLTSEIWNLLVLSILFNYYSILISGFRTEDLASSWTFSWCHGWYWWNWMTWAYTWDSQHIKMKGIRCKHPAVPIVSRFRVSNTSRIEKLLHMWEKSHSRSVTAPQSDRFPAKWLITTQTHAKKNAKSNLLFNKKKALETQIDWKHWIIPIHRVDAG